MSLAPWLAIIGIGEDGLDGLSPAASRALAQAELIVGGARHLALIGATPAETLAWPTPLTDAVPVILARRGRPVAVLATGDPFQFGVGTTLAAHVPVEEMIVLPGISAFSLAAARLGWPLQDTRTISLHGRSFERIIPALQPSARILALSWDGSTPARLAELLVARGLGPSQLIVLEAMGGPRERIRRTTAAGYDLADLDPLNTVAIAVVAASPSARILPRAPGLPDDWFEHDGQITKRDVRAVTLSALSPRAGELLWDVGAGSGSIGIEWMLADPANRAVAIEPNPSRAACIGRNAAALGVPGLTLVAAEAPAAFTGLPPPDAIFIGGGATDPGVLEGAWGALPAGGRLVVNAVTLETQAALVAARQRHGGDFVQMAFSEAEPIGGFTGWHPARPIIQWRVDKRS